MRVGFVFYYVRLLEGYNSEFQTESMQLPNVGVGSEKETQSSTSEFRFLLQE